MKTAFRFCLILIFFLSVCNQLFSQTLKLNIPKTVLETESILISGEDKYDWEASCSYERGIILGRKEMFKGVAIDSISRYEFALKLDKGNTGTMYSVDFSIEPGKLHYGDFKMRKNG